GHETGACLNLADIVPQLEIDLALEVIDLVAEGGQQPLQLDARLTRKRALDVGPATADFSGALHAVGKVEGSKRIGVGIVVALDRFEIPGDEKSGSAMAAWKKESRMPVRRHRTAVGAREPERGPAREGGPALAIIERLGDRDLKAPGQPGDPAVLAEVIGDRSETIGHVGPDIGTAVAGKIDGVAQK